MTTRRWFCAQIVAALAVFQDDGISHAAESIHQQVMLKLAPDRIYAALLDERQFSAMTGGLAARIDPHEGGAFSLFGDQITGRTVQLVPNTRIVQAWRSGSWDPGVYSIARFELSAAASGTKLVLDHTGFPTGQAAHLAAGWKDHYWNALQRLDALGLKMK
jgi:activator of HSP90 ATPase